MSIAPATILSFDVEEHHRIEAAVHHACPPAMQGEYNRRMEATTRNLLETLARFDVKATFFIVGEIARTNPSLVRDIHSAGHEIASHSWNHQRIHRFNPASFRDDLLQSKEALEDVIGIAVQGFRAPTFSVMRQTAWAIDVLAECGFLYDSSIFPVRHDRYGVPDAPRTPFFAQGSQRTILELPPVTWRCFRMNIPVAGGGYFRLFPLALMRAGIRQMLAHDLPVAMLYFHPWEFDADQPRLPLGRLSRWRTYVGTWTSMQRLEKLIRRQGPYARAIDVAKQLQHLPLQMFPLEALPESTGN